MHRRQWQRTALALALTPWLRAQAQSPATASSSASIASLSSPIAWSQGSPFALGVASGSPRADSVVLWTRLLHVPAGQTRIQVAWEVYSDASLRQSVQRGSVSTDASRGFSVHVTVSRLSPARPYWYRFFCGDAASPVGRTATTPQPGDHPPSLSLALASCQHYEQGYYAAYRDMAQSEIDLVLFVGDYIYEGSNPSYRIRSHNEGIPHTLDEYRARYALYKSDPDLQAAHAAHPWMLMWDDHEVVNDYANDRSSKNEDPVQFLRRRAAAYQAYFEHQPLRIGPDSAGSPHMRLYDQLQWGRLATLWTLDNRQYKSPLACPDPVRGGGRMVVACDELQDKNRSLWGKEQEAWLQRGLSASKTTWRLVAQATQMSSRTLPTPAGLSSHTDGWDGYPAARERFLRSIANQGLGNVVVLGGDVHMNVAAHLRVQPGDAQSPVIASEIVTTSISSRGMSPSLLSRLMAANPDIQYARSDERGYTRLHLNAERLLAEFRTTAFPVQEDARLSTQAKFRVRSGTPGVQRVEESSEGNGLRQSGRRSS